MGKIITKLNLNKTPQLVENNSLVFAKNIKLKDGAFGPDFAVTKLKEVIPIEGDIAWQHYNNIGYVGQIVGVNNKVYFFVEEENEWSGVHPLTPYYSVKILEYDESTNVFTYIHSGWKYSGGQITGCVTVNNTNEYILTICEYGEGLHIPIKHINLSKCKDTDDESIYTQAPNIPIINFTLNDTYTRTIPNGVYQFFVRYKIRDNFYTNWMPCSKECFAGSSQTTDTIQGTLKYVDVKKDAGSSFVFGVESLFDEYNTNFEEFQVGFILSNDDATVARSWKSFPLDTKEIYFDYDEGAIKEIDIDDLLKVNYDLTNVKNIGYFKNKLYIANYEESDFNPDLNSYAKQVQITLNKEVLDTASSVYVGENKLTKSNEDLSYYDKWGNRPIIDLFNASVFNRIYASTNNDGQYSTDQDDDHYALLAKAYCKLSINPDVYWINDVKVTDDQNYTPLTNAVLNLSGSRKYNWKDAGYLRDNGNWYFYDTNTHPLAKLPVMKGKWYWAGYSTYPYIRNNQPNSFKIDNQGVSTNREKAEQEWQKDLTNAVKDVCGETRLVRVYIKVGGENIYLYGENNTHKTVAENFDGLLIDKNYSVPEDVIKREAINLIKDHIVGVDSTNTNNYVIRINGTNYTISNYYIEYSTYTYSTAVTDEPSPADGGDFETEYKVNVTRQNKVIFTQISIDSKNTTTGYVEAQRNTLLPFTEYEFYIHYVKKNGIATNGYLIGTQQLDDYAASSDTSLKIIYPSFSNIVQPEGYDACFISICKTGNDIAKGFNHALASDDVHYLNCLEADALLYNLVDNITIIDSQGLTITTEAKYNSSNTTNPLTLFGCCGLITWDKAAIESHTSSYDGYWIKINKKTSGDKDKQLIKLTPYIKFEENNGIASYDIYNNMNMPGYFNKVIKFDRSTNNTIYASGNDLFTKTIHQENYLELEANSDFQPLVASTPAYVLSNFNLNYLSLIQDLVPKIRAFGATEEADKDRQMIIGIDSQLASSILELKSMYKDYTRKYYSIYNKESVNVFDNTIRSSDINTDEIYRNIYRFEATDYYNVPTNKGKIINLFGIVNSVYVHTEHSLFEFSGSNTLTSNDSNVQLQESNVFDTGIKEIFDDQNGYAGIQDKKHSLITHNSYIFYDKLANVIYAYGGNSQLTTISDSISKIINWFRFDDVRFVNDDYNKRFFINLRKNSEGVKENICLTYSFEAKSFISVHDIDFDECFNTRNSCYFILRLGTGYGIYKDDKDSYNDYKKLFAKSKLYHNDMFYPINSIGYEVENSLDIIYNINYESIKSLQYINWICSEITGYNTTDNLAEENLNRKYSGTKIRIYSDECATDLIDLVDNDGNPLIQNPLPLNNPNNKIYPRYNCGIWSLNYFRDTKNTDNIYNYPIAEKSLIYGKYFVVRMIFKNKNFKFENIIFNTKNYDKI